MALTKAHNRMIDGSSINVVDYGADPTGVADSTSAIQTAIYAGLSQRKAVKLPGGLFKVSQLILKRGTRLIGEGYMGTQPNQTKAQTTIQQIDGNEKSMIILEPTAGPSGSGAEADDIHVSDMLLYGPSSATTGEYHGIEFVDSDGDALSVAGTAVFERLYFRDWKGSGIKTGTRVYALIIQDCRSIENGRYGFEINGNADAIKISNVTVEQNRLAGIYLGEQPANFMSSVDNVYAECAFSNPFGNHPDFAFACPYVIEFGATANQSNSVWHLSNINAKANQGTNVGCDAVFYLNYDGASGEKSPNLIWTNVVPETQVAVTGNQSIVYDKYASSRIGGDNAVSGKYFQDGSYETSNWSGTRFSKKISSENTTGTASPLTLNRPNAGRVLLVEQDGTNFGSLKSVDNTNPDLYILNERTDWGIRLIGTSGLMPCSSTGLNLDDQRSLGVASSKWSVVFAGTGSINTSDERKKQDIRELSEKEKAVAVSLKSLVKAFRFNNAVEQKGDDARIHVGVIAQEVIAAFEAEGLDPMRYGIVCYDEWEDGNSYGIRYEELLAFIISAL